MTPREVIIIVTAIAIITIAAQYLHARHELAKRYRAGWDAGWDTGRDELRKDWSPETPEPKGRHHGLSQPEDWTATDLIEFIPPPLPKRIPGASR